MLQKSTRQREPCEKELNNRKMLLDGVGVEGSSYTCRIACVFTCEAEKNKKSYLFKSFTIHAINFYFGWFFACVARWSTSASSRWLASGNINELVFPFFSSFPHPILVSRQYCFFAFDSLLQKWSQSDALQVGFMFSSSACFMLLCGALFGCLQVNASKIGSDWMPLITLIFQFSQQSQKDYQVSFLWLISDDFSTFASAFPSHSHA